MLEWLKGILGEAYTEEIDKQVSDEIGKGFIARADFNTVNETKKGLEKQLIDANKAIDDMKALDVDGMKKAAEEWKEKYENDTATLKADLEASKYAHTIDTLSLKEKFTSEAARKAFVNDLITKKLPIEEGKLVGYDDFKKSYMEADPGAFAAEEAKMKMSTGGEHKEPGSTENDTFTAAAMKGAGLDTGKGE